MRTAACGHGRRTGPGLRTTLHGDRHKEQPVGWRPGSVPDPRPQERVHRHNVEHLTDLVGVAPVEQILDALVLKMVDNLMDAFGVMDQPIAEQVIAVPKIVASS